MVVAGWAKQQRWQNVYGTPDNPGQERQIRHSAVPEREETGEEEKGMAKRQVSFTS